MNRQSRQHIKVAIVQSTPTPRDLESNAQKINATMKQVSEHCDLVLFPELYLSGYQTENLSELAVDEASPIIRDLASTCKEHHIALLVGGVERVEQGYYNSFIAIDNDGTLRRFIRKTHLFGTEQTAFLAGNCLKPVELCNISVGVINCFEIEFPEVARTLTHKGAQVILSGSANMHPYTDDHRIASTARVLENRIPLAYANRVGSESGHTFCGFSRALDGNGTLLLEAGPNHQTILFASLQLNQSTKPETDMLAQLKPDLYC